ncbi:hypothetical protein GQ44DRAFT_704737 [Phaeosphaeriaceae sp. PMI808]|nr:hypothetical protein GQ44DRAFT_704737 [Phaeosphaeriaceae sp. PMI808]
MVAKAKRTTANAHDKRHENGNAAPGRRIIKQKSSSQLNGNGHATIGTHTNTAVASTTIASHVDKPVTTTTTTTTTNTMTHPATNTNGILSTNVPMSPPAAHERVRAASDASLDHGDASCRLFDAANASFVPVSVSASAPRRLDYKSAHVSMASILAVPATILTSCPLRDVLAILILLLQLPPTVLTVVQFLFATLTFVPPQAGTPLSALSAFPSFTDIFQGSGGTPSLFTTIFADAFILVIWLILWVPVQNFFLDLAQAVIAIALGGAAAGKNGTTNSIFICFLIILSNHLFKFRPLRQHFLHFLWTGLTRGGLDFLTGQPSSPTSSLESFSSPHGWPRSLLGIHILAQGVVRIIRRSLSRRDVTPSLPTGKKTDPEAGVPQRPNSTALDPTADVPNSSSTDGRPPGPSPAAHSKTDKASSSRRKRKQATHVRSQQPFWAALASTKVTVLKEMESSRAANDADEANAKDANHIGNAVWRSEDDRVWVSEVGYSDISFRVSLYTGVEFQEQNLQESTLGSGIDKSKPFYIRVNGADWSSTRIRQSTSLGYQGQEGTGFWVGEIFGLTALSNYQCEFVRTVDNEVFYSASLITSASPVAELASVASPPAHQTLRPSSPTTTLKNSIAAADQQLQEHRNRLKRNKKDHKAAITTIRKEVDTLSNRLANAGGSDERQRQRVLQFTQTIRQADDSAADYALQADNLGDIPDNDAQEAAAKKAEWKKERDNKNTISGEFDNIKTEIERQVQSIESDVAGSLQKRERLQQRQTRLNEQHDRLVTANAEGFTAMQRREQERTALRQQRIDVENQYRSNINGYERRTEEHNLSTTQIMQTIQHYEDLLLQQSQQHMSVPTTPEGPLPGTSMSPHANAFTSFTFPSFNSHVNSTPGSLRNGRGRSSSMLSNISGFTDGFDESHSLSGYTLSNPFHAPLLNGHNGSHGSGSLSSGTSSQSSSQRDPMSPVQAIKPIMLRSPTSGSAGLMSPIGTGR